VRVLVAEDEPRMATLLQRGLIDEGYSVDVTSTGTDALWMGTEHDYDAIVLDWMLPELSGEEICRELRRRSRWAPIVMLTARTGVEDRVRGLDAGADDYLSKPFSFAELTARLRALMRRGAIERPALITVGSLSLDPASRVVSAGATILSLSAKEYAVLELLARNVDVVLTRERILDHAWDFAYEPNSNVVDQYVGYVRRKVAAATDSVVIATVRGVGYRLSSA
jgi:two-component system OmpR family response regulator